MPALQDAKTIGEKEMNTTEFVLAMNILGLWIFAVWIADHYDNRINNLVIETAKLITANELKVKEDE